MRPSASRRPRIRSWSPGSRASFEVPPSADKGRWGVRGVGEYGARRTRSATAGPGKAGPRGTPVTMEYLLRAVNRELEKLGRPVAPGPKAAKAC